MNNPAGDDVLATANTYESLSAWTVGRSIRELLRRGVEGRSLKATLTLYVVHLLLIAVGVVWLEPIYGRTSVLRILPFAVIVTAAIECVWVFGPTRRETRTSAAINWRFDSADVSERRTMFKEFVERPFAAALLVLVLPTLFMLALAVKLTSRGPVFHRRRVVSQGGGTFDVLKFRTMVVNADEVFARDTALGIEFEPLHKFERDPRLTRIGAVLRQLRLDGLPQLINVVRGEMWLVGSRMITPEELDKYGQHASELLSIKPGITGLWQVTGRHDVSYEQRIELEMRYIRYWSFVGDVMILIKAAAVLPDRGAH